MRCAIQIDVLPSQPNQNTTPLAGTQPKYQAERLPIREVPVLDKIVDTVHKKSTNF